VAQKEDREGGASSCRSLGKRSHGTRARAHEGLFFLKRDLPGTKHTFCCGAGGKKQRKKGGRSLEEGRSRRAVGGKTQRKSETRSKKKLAGCVIYSPARCVIGGIKVRGNKESEVAALEEWLTSRIEPVHMVLYK